jgi:hypothetical protein
LARLAEGHADARANLGELSLTGYEDTPRGQRWGVWAAVPTSVTARRIGAGWLLDGDRPWCSGAAACTHALLTEGAPACWYGGALGVADTLLRASRARALDPHALAHLGCVDAELAEAGALLRETAAAIDAKPADCDPVPARRLRAIAEACATSVMRHVGDEPRRPSAGSRSFVYGRAACGPGSRPHRLPETEPC